MYRNHLARCLAGRYQFPTFRLRSVLPQTSRIILCKTRPDPVGFWLIVSGSWAKLIRSGSKAGVQESSGPKRANASQQIRTACESEAEVKVPSDKHLTSRETAVFQTINYKTRRRRPIQFCCYCCCCCCCCCCYCCLLLLLLLFVCVCELSLIHI